jgi:hypothetical protein
MILTIKGRQHYKFDNIFIVEPSRQRRADVIMETTTKQDHIRKYSEKLDGNGPNIN